MPPTLRIATQNLWGGAPLWPIRLRALARSLHNQTDILLLQESRRRGQSSQAHLLAQRLSLPHIASAEAGPAIGGHEGLAILSRFPILHSATFHLPQNKSDFRDRIAPRILLRAVIATPLGPIAAVSLHLSLSPAARLLAIDHLHTFLQSEQQLHPTIATILGGDFNASPSGSAIKKLLSLPQNFSDASAPAGLTYPALLPLQRLDYLFITPNLEPQKINRIFSLGSDHRALTLTVSPTTATNLPPI